MLDAKLRFTAFLEDAALPLSFSATQLSSVPNVRDDEDSEDPEELLRLKLALASDESPDHEESGEDNDSRLFSLLKSYLDDGDGPHDDHPSGVDHDEMRDINPEGELDNAGPFEPRHSDDGPHSGETADANAEDEKHNQLLAAIDDLRQELKTMKSGESQPQSAWKVTRMDGEEQEEDPDAWMKDADPCPECKGSGKVHSFRCFKCKGLGVVDPVQDDRGYLTGRDDFDKRSYLSREENEESYEEDEQEDTKQASARQLFTSLVNQGKPRQDIIDQFMKQIGVTQSTATSYYQRLAKEAGLTTSGNREMPGEKEPPGLGVAAGIDPQGMAGHPGMEQGQQGMGMPEQPESNIDGFEVQDDPNKQGLIRTVKGAHLVYKRKNEEGSFDELWVFKTGKDMKSSLDVRRAILAGTDIPPRSTKSLNGSQSYTLWSSGDGQLLHIKGLPN